MPPTITVIAAALNEAIQAAEWLEHLRWADEIVVVDMGSRDGTREILERGGARVEDFREVGKRLIHCAKNQAIEKARSEWILDLDLDERVSLPLRDELRSRVSDATTAAAFEIPFRHYVFGRWLEYGGWKDVHLRFFRAGRVKYPEDRAHSTPEVDGEIERLNEVIVHFAHPSLHDFMVKMNRYTSQDAPLILEHGRGGLRNRPPLSPRPLSWVRASLSVFWSRYVKRAGLRDGVPGFLAATMLSAYVFVEQAKVWEAQQLSGDTKCPSFGE
jgi:glycosyltransferase involved in cell wall biosynthesis